MEIFITNEVLILNLDRSLISKLNSIKLNKLGVNKHPFC